MSAGRPGMRCGQQGPEAEGKCNLLCGSAPLHASFSRYTVNVKPGGTEQSPGRHGDRSRPPLEQRQVVFVAAEARPLLSADGIKPSGRSALIGAFGDSYLFYLFILGCETL